MEEKMKTVFAIIGVVVAIAFLIFNAVIFVTSGLTNTTDEFFASVKQ